VEFSLFRSINVALKIDAHGSGRAAFAGFAAPNAGVVFFQFGDVGVAGFLDFRLGLSFRELLRPATGAFELF
jgi:hypothetical protein